MSGIDIVIPVYNEGVNITSVLSALARDVKTPFRVLICYDFEEDNTLPALRDREPDGIDIQLVKNPERGPHAAVRAGLRASSADAVLVFMADDDFNTRLVDDMYLRLMDGADVVAASRFMPDGMMQGSAFHKWLITRVGTWATHFVARMPTRDATNAFRMFSRRLIDTVEIESRVGFTFAIELMVKAVRLGWRVDEVPAKWFEREDKPSRFQVFRWLPYYFHWFLYAVATTWLRRGPETVKRRA
jgi:glycosyltransferase involved in cell wall biosynthesis